MEEVSVKPGEEAPKDHHHQNRVAAEERALALAKLSSARVATAADREILSAANKQNIHSVKVLGEGAFGIVDLCVVDVAGGDHLLCVRKKLLKQSDHNNNDPEVELSLLEMMTSFNLVVQMWSSVEGLYDYTLLLEYCPYGSLQGLLNVVSEQRSRSNNACMDWFTDKVLRSERHAGLKETEARFYAACAVLGLEQMHSRGVMHRDMKPANCLIAHNGYLKVADLGLAKELGEEGRAHTHVGTPGYMAPEVAHGANNKHGYSYPADVWSLGMMVWEMVEGLLPKWAIMSWYWTSLHFPDAFSQDLRSLLTGMLEKAPKDRLGLQEIKRHAWFKGVDWEAIGKETLTPPRMEELKRVHIHTSLMRGATTNASSYN